VITNRNTYRFSAAEFTRLLDIGDHGAISTLVWSVQARKVIIMIHGRQPRHFSEAEFTRLLGIRDPRRVITVKWHARESEAAVWMEPR
jgi:hypothetical protein